MNNKHRLKFIIIFLKQVRILIKIAQKMKKSIRNKTHKLRKIQNKYKFLTLMM